MPKKRRNNGRNKNNKGQVAVEFIMMFVVCVSVLIYIFYLSFSLASVQYKNYITFMIGRAVAASAPTYAEKKN